MEPEEQRRGGQWSLSMNREAQGNEAGWGGHWAVMRNPAGGFLASALIQEHLLHISRPNHLLSWVSLPTNMPPVTGSTFPQHPL